MKRFIHIALLTVCFSLVVFVLPSLHARPADAQSRSAPVVVTNTPLPVTGSVNVGNLPSNQTVNFNGTPQPVTGSVNVGNLPSSQIVNFNGTPQPVSLSTTPLTPLLVRDVDRPARHPFSIEMQAEINNGSPDSTKKFFVPAGKEFVIETVSASTFTPGQKSWAEVQYYTGSNRGDIYVPLKPQGTFYNQDMSDNTLSTRAYASPGTLMSFFAQRSSTSGDAVWIISASGYLVDCGAGTTTDPCPVP